MTPGNRFTLRAVVISILINAYFAGAMLEIAISNDWMARNAFYLFLLNGVVALWGIKKLPNIARNLS